MALKGTTKIELTNVKTGEVEILQETNMVTNAISDILNTDPLNMRWDYAMARNFLLPVISQLVGGIVLFEDALEENAEKYYAPASNMLTGYSNTGVSTSTDVKRGSMNQTESGPLEDGTGYRFVFDFANTQGNGKISAVSLTSQHMGICGYGSPEHQDHNGSTTTFGGDHTLAFPLCAYTQESYDTGDFQDNGIIPCIVFVDFDTGVAYALHSSAAYTIDIYKIKLTGASVGLMMGGLFGNRKPELIATLTTSTFHDKHSTGANYYSFCDGLDGYIWGVSGPGNVSSGTTVQWIKINKTDWSFTEGTWTFPETVVTGGTTKGNFSYSSNHGNLCKFIVYKGMAYLPAYSLKKVFILNTQNPTDISVVESENTISPYSMQENGGCYFNVMGDVVYTSAGYIADKVFYPKYWAGQNRYPQALAYTGRPNIRKGPIVFGFCGDTTRYNYARAFLDNSYLATINNLQNPVQKTADKTMKITYILREES